MNFLKTKHTVLFAIIAAGIMPAAAAFAQADLLPPPFETAPRLQATPTPQPVVEYLSEDELERSFERALNNFGQNISPVTQSQDPQTAQTPAEAPTQVGEVPQGTNETPTTPGTQLPAKYPTNTPAIVLATEGPGADAVPIGQVRLDVALENMPLETVMENVVRTVSTRSGIWNVRWRLSSENQRLLGERVNINAETDFETFMAYLVERVNNMTGVQLFVKVFEGSRLIIIADNY